MSKHRKSTRAALTSLDGKRTITAREFERLFDEGSDEIDQFIDWSTAQIEGSRPKKPITLRLDADILDWFKSFGRGYQTRINTVLRTYKRAREKA